MRTRHDTQFSMTRLAVCLGMAFTSPTLWAQATTSSTDTTLPTFKVTAEGDKAKQEAGSSKTLSADELERASSLEDVVRYQPLVSAPGVANGASRNKSSFDRSGTTGYNIRGVEGNRVGLDVDGVEMPSASTRPYVSRVGVNTFGVGRDFIDPEMYSSVDIDSGTTAARRTAGGIGGSVGFRSKSPENYLKDGKTSYFNSKLAYDSADRSWNESITATGRSGDNDALLAYSRRDGHATSNNSGTVTSNPNDWHSDALLLKGGTQLNAEHALSLSADIYRRQNNTEFSGWNSGRTAITEFSAQNSGTERETLQLTHQWTPTNAVVDHVDTRVFFQSARTDDVTDTTTLSSGATAHNTSGTRSDGWGFSSTADKRIGNHQLSAGINASIEESERPWNVSGTVKPQPDATTNRTGAFLQDDISFQLAGKRLTVTPGIRVDDYKVQARDLSDLVSGSQTLAGVQALYGNAYTSTIVSPSVGLVYDLTPQFSTYAQYKHGGRAPTAGELFGSWSNGTSTASYYLVGNTNLKPETSDTIDIGLKGSPVEGVKLNASMFYSQYKNFIAYTRYTRSGNPELFTSLPSSITTLYQAENRDEATIYGLEANTRLEHGVWTPSLKGIYSTWAIGWSRGTSKSNYTGDKDVDLDSVQPRKAIIGVGYDAPQKSWGLNLTGTFVASKQAVYTNRDTYSNSGTALTDSTTVLFKVPGYAVFDVAGYWQVNKVWRMNAGINNLADKRYWDYASAHNLQPSVAGDRYDMALLTNPGRTVNVSLSATF
jgi:hemoglobin/transferrin/lactoferrin receptor protein